MASVIRSWRDQSPRITHLSAIIWDVFRQKGRKDMTPEQAPLERIAGLTFHQMQGGKEGDYHDHEDQEQIYYFTKGRAKMKVSGKFYNVREGDALYIPHKNKHQLISDSEDWVHHIIFGCRVSDEALQAPADPAPKMVQCNWQGRAPAIEEPNVISWPIFLVKGAEGKTEEEAPLLGLYAVRLETVQAGKASEYVQHDNIEQVYFFTKGRGKIKLDDKVSPIRYGDAVHIPAGTKHQVINDAGEWLEYILAAAKLDPGQPIMKTKTE